jgi:hypothetical protein
MPPHPSDLEPNFKLPDNGTLIVGSKATALANLYYRSVRIVPEAKRQEMSASLPPKTIPRIEGTHFDEWVRACKGGEPAGSNFEIASRLTELCLLSNVAVRARVPIEWDAEAMKVRNLPDANKYLTKDYRPGHPII